MNAARPFQPGGGERRVHIVQGQHYVTDDPNVVLTTTLGSCVAACLRDPLVEVGGMNHFLLPDGDEREGAAAVRYGAYAMELLINALLVKGARRERLEAKLFGGANLINGLTDVGGQNVTFAEGFLEREGIPVVGGSLRGNHARRVQCWPVSGRVLQMKLVRGEESLFARERTVAAPQGAGAVELFGEERS